MLEMGCQRPKPLAFRSKLKNYENLEAQADKSDNCCMDASKAARLKVVAEIGTDAIPTERTRVAMKDFKGLYTEAFEATHVNSIQDTINNQNVDCTETLQVCWHTRTVDDVDGAASVDKIQYSMQSLDSLQTLCCRPCGGSAVDMLNLAPPRVLKRMAKSSILTFSSRHPCRSCRTNQNSKCRVSTC